MSVQENERIGVIEIMLMLAIASLVISQILALFIDV